MAKTFGNEFVMGKLDYPAENFRVPSWIHERNKNQWALLTKFVLANFQKELKDIRLFVAVRAAQYDIATNPALLFAIMELFNHATGTFFTPDSEIGFTLHEIWQLSGLAIGDIAKNISSVLKSLRSYPHKIVCCITLKDLAYHFCIYSDLSDTKGVQCGIRSRLITSSLTWMGKGLLKGLLVSSNMSVWLILVQGFLSQRLVIAF